MITPKIRAPMTVPMIEPRPPESDLPRRHRGIEPPPADRIEVPVEAIPPVGRPAEQLDLILKERLAQGQPDTPELRAVLRDELINRELFMRADGR